MRISFLLRGRCNRSRFGRGFLLAIDGDGALRTDERTIGASRAVVLDEYDKSVADAVDAIRQSDTFLRTCRNAEFASLADFLSNGD
jgi:hypothetical protein